MNDRLLSLFTLLNVQPLFRPKVLQRRQRALGGWTILGMYLERWRCSNHSQAPKGEKKAETWSQCRRYYMLLWSAALGSHAEAKEEKKPKEEKKKEEPKPAATKAAPAPAVVASGDIDAEITELSRLDS